MSCCGSFFFPAEEKNDIVLSQNGGNVKPNAEEIPSKKEESNRLLRYKLSKERPWGISRAELLDAEVRNPSFSLELQPSISSCSTLSMESCSKERRWVDWRFNENLSPLRTGSDDFSFRESIKHPPIEEPEPSCLCIDAILTEPIESL